MVKAILDPKFKKKLLKIKDNSLKDRIIKQLEKLKLNPEFGKPMRFARKGTRELHVQPHRIAYIYLPEKEVIIFLDIYHKDIQ
ncbi:type II toxin-antitoxin system RelE/ParE family toxin [Candidatus Woesearchaeota archaeon]|jgi:mRNA-degrading endonuclease RelE of RelBE toxin-antitoxin system|nr:type II toxin-antitoxin system RelE/ParE family toxin [Candidatus Woesearchaeota archaeon]